MSTMFLTRTAAAVVASALVTTLTAPSATAGHIELEATKRNAAETVATQTIIRELDEQLSVWAAEEMTSAKYQRSTDQSADRESTENLDVWRGLSAEEKKQVAQALADPGLLEAIATNNIDAAHYPQTRAHLKRVERHNLSTPRGARGSEKLWSFTQTMDWNIFGFTLTRITQEFKWAGTTTRSSSSKSCIATHKNRYPLRSLSESTSHYHHGKTARCDTIWTIRFGLDIDGIPLHGERQVQQYTKGTGKSVRYNVVTL